MKSEKLSILRLADRDIGMLTDHRGWPPSNRGEVKHLLRKGFLVKRRTIGRSMVHTTDKGKEYLKKHG